MLRKQSYRHLTRLSWSAWLVAAVLAVLGVLAVQTSSNAQEVPQDVPQKVLEQNSLAGGYFNNGDFEAALPYLRWLLENAPTVYNSERIHRRAVTTYRTLADSTLEQELKAAYLDSAFAILQRAPQTFKDAGIDYDEARWENDFGNFLVKYDGQIDTGDEQAVAHYRTAYDLAPEKSDPYYVKMIVREYVKLGMTDEAVSFMEDVEAYFSEDAELVAWMEDVRDKIIRSPEDRIDYLLSKLAKDSTDVATTRELYEIYGQLGRTDEMSTMGERLLEVAPSAETYTQVADLKSENGMYAEGLDLYAKALKLTPDSASTAKRDLQFKMAVNNYELGRLEVAKRHAVKTINQDRKYGNAYILIGDILVKAISESEFGRTDKAVYWLAMDYYEMAASVDPEVRATARAKVEQYRPYMPTDEEKFFAGWQTGEEYAIDYGRYEWVGETTEVR